MPLLIGRLAVTDRDIGNAYAPDRDHQRGDYSAFRHGSSYHEPAQSPTGGLGGFLLAVPLSAILWLLIGLGVAHAQTPTHDQAAAAAATLNAYFNAAPAPAAPAQVSRPSPFSVAPKLTIPETVILPGERVAHVHIRLAQPVPGRQLAWKYGTFNLTGVYAPLHYKQVAGTVTFLPGETEKIVDVPINMDIGTGTIGFSVASSLNNPPAGSASGVIRQAATRVDLAPVPQPVLPQPMKTAGRSLVFSSTFHEPIAADAVKGAWRSHPDWGRVQTGNREIAPYANAATDPGTTPHSFDANGNLVLRAEHVPVKEGPSTYAYSASMIMSARLATFRTGYFEVEAKMDRAQGTIPAIWLIPADGSWPPEIDVIESGLADNDQMARTDHDKVWNMEGIVVPFSPTDGKFHTYGLEITAEMIFTFVDGVEVHRRANPWPPIDWQFVFDVAVGGLAPEPKNPGKGWKSEMTLRSLKVWQ